MSLDIANSVADVLYRLGFTDSTDLANNSAWLTSTELYQWADEEGKALSYRTGLFVTYDTSITVTSGTAAWTLPSNHVFTVAAWLGTQPLRITRVADLWALDSLWSATSGPAKRASLDAAGVGTIVLYPNPTSGGTLAQVCAEFPSTIASGSSTISLPLVLQDLFSYAMLAGARGKESEAAMPEMAKHFRDRVTMYEQVIQHLYGPGQ